MKEKQKSKLKDQLKTLGQNRCLYDLLYCSFTRKYDSHIYFSASDYAHAINTMLEMHNKNEDNL